MFRKIMLLVIIFRISLIYLLFSRLCQGSDYGDDEEIVITFEEDMLGLETILSMNEDDRGNALQDERFKWPNATVFYQLSDRFSCEEKCVIHEAMLEIEKKTCLNFVQREYQHDYVDIVTGEICASYVGRQGGAQKLYLSTLCVLNIGNVMHELMHAVGFFHEHSRADRNDFIDIKWENIERRDHKNFENHNLGNVTTYDVPYDYNSLMHYGSTYFSKNGKVTIKTKQDQDKDKIGQRLRLSESDVKRINLHYKCNPDHFGCIDKQVSCKNGTMEIMCKKQRMVREKICRKSCGQCQLKICPCTNYTSQCNKWAENNECPTIDDDVRKGYFNHCESC